MTFARLRRMPIAEIAVRGRQQGFKWLDRLDGGARVRRAGAAPFTTPDPATFFAGAADPATPGLVSELAPDAAAALIDGARDAMSGSFDLLG